MTATDHSIAARVERLAGLDEDGAFLREAYLLVLGRAADRDGEAAYRARLAAGEPRPRILHELAQSDEGRRHLARAPATAKALGPVGSAEVAASTSVACLLELSDEAFVETATRLVLGVDADAASRIRLSTRLRGGVPRYRILQEMALAGGQAAFPEVEGLDDLLARMREGLFPVAKTLEELFQYHDEAFVDCAYKTLLQRAPDPAGLSHYLGRIREGHSRTSVVASLAESGEARACRASVQGLDALCRRYWLANRPLVGRVLARLLRVESDAPAVRRHRLLASLATRSHALQAQIDAMSQRIAPAGAEQNSIEAALLDRHNAMIEIQRDSFDREINALRKLVVRCIDRADAKRTDRRVAVMRVRRNQPRAR